MGTRAGTRAGQREEDDLGWLLLTDLDGPRLSLMRAPACRAAGFQGEYYVTGYNGCEEVYTPVDATVRVVDVQEEEAAEPYNPRGPDDEADRRVGTRRGLAGAGTPSTGLLYGVVGAAVVLLLWRLRRRLMRPFLGLPVFSKPAPRMRP